MTHRIDRYARFFREMDGAINQPSDITQASLFKLFGADGLRRAYLPTQFIIEHVGLRWDALDHTQAIEYQKIEGQRQKWIGKSWLQDMEDYLQYLYATAERTGRAIKPLTIRIYLNASVRLLSDANVERAKDINNRHIASLLRKSRGLAASLTSFRSFLNHQYGIDVNVAKSRATPLPQFEKALVGEVEELIARLRVTSGRKVIRAVLARLLSKLYQVPLSDVLGLQWNEVEKVDSSWVVSVKGQGIRLDPRIGVYFNALAFAGREGYVFSGRNPYQPLSYAAVRYHLVSA